MSKWTAKKADGNFVDIGNGLKKQVFRHGTAGCPPAGSVVTIHYTNYAKNGTKLDSSKNRKAITFTLGKGEVIKGWDLVIATMQTGECVKVKLPPNLAYGAQGKKPNIPGNAIIIVDLELLHWSFDGWIGDDFSSEEEMEIPEEPCYTCKKRLLPGWIQIKYKGTSTYYHRDCYLCCTCKCSLIKKGTKHFKGDIGGGNPKDMFCISCFYKTFGQICEACKHVIKGSKVKVFGKIYHPNHFGCEVCRKPFMGKPYHSHQGKAYCSKHNPASRALPKQVIKKKIAKYICVGCTTDIYGRSLKACGSHWHPDCFKCHFCGKPLAHAQHYEHGDKPYCYLHQYSWRETEKKKKEKKKLSPKNPSTNLPSCIIQASDIAQTATWSAHTDPKTGRTYYKNHTTKTTQWAKPTGTLIQKKPHGSPKSPRTPTSPTHPKSPPSSTSPKYSKHPPSSTSPKYSKHPPSSTSPKYPNSILQDPLLPSAKKNPKGSFKKNRKFHLFGKGKKEKHVVLPPPKSPPPSQKKRVVVSDLTPKHEEKKKTPPGHGGSRPPPSRGGARSPPSRGGSRSPPGRGGARPPPGRNGPRPSPQKKSQPAFRGPPIAMGESYSSGSSDSDDNKTAARGNPIATGESYSSGSSSGGTTDSDST